MAFSAKAAFPAAPPTRSSECGTQISVPGFGQGVTGPMIQSMLTLPITVILLPSAALLPAPVRVDRLIPGP